MKRQRSKIIRQSAIGVKEKGALKICARRKAPKKCSMVFMKAKLLRRSESPEYCTKRRVNFHAHNCEIRVAK